MPDDKHPLPTVDISDPRALLSMFSDDFLSFWRNSSPEVRIRVAETLTSPENLPFVEEHSHIPTDCDRLLRMDLERYPDYGDGRLDVLLFLAGEGVVPERHMTKKLLGYVGKFGYLFAGKCADNGHLPPSVLDMEVLSMTDAHDAGGESVAHHLASEGALPKEFFVPEVLGLRDSFGTTLTESCLFNTTPFVVRKFFDSLSFVPDDALDIILGAVGSDRGETDKGKYSAGARLVMSALLRNRREFTPPAGFTPTELRFGVPFAFGILNDARSPGEALFVHPALFLSKACEMSGDSHLVFLNDEARDTFFELVSAVLDEAEERPSERARLMDVLTVAFGKVREIVLEHWGKETDKVEKTVARMAAMAEMCGGDGEEGAVL